MSPFEVAYGFNPLTPSDLLPIPVEHLTSVSGVRRAEQVKEMHQQVRDRIELAGVKTAKQRNLRRKQLIFQPGDKVWIHLRPGRFPNLRKSKLSPRGDGPFTVLSRVNDNAYRIDLPGEYKCSSTFNVSDLLPYTADPFDEDESLDSRTNPFQEGGSDENSQGVDLGSENAGSTSDLAIVPKLQNPVNRAPDIDLELQIKLPVTQLQAKRLQQHLQGVVRRQFELLEFDKIISSSHVVNILTSYEDDVKT